MQILGIFLLVYFFFRLDAISILSWDTTEEHISSRDYFIWIMSGNSRRIVELESN